MRRNSSRYSDPPGWPRYGAGLFHFLVSKLTRRAGVNCTEKQFCRAGWSGTQQFMLLCYMHPRYTSSARDMNYPKRNPPLSLNTYVVKAGYALPHACPKHSQFFAGLYRNERHSTWFRSTRPTRINFRLPELDRV